jgi:hypothetical protein
MRRSSFRAALAALAFPVAALAQDWNTPDALALARRGTERRTRTAADTSLRDYRALAHGFLFFLGQLGEGLAEPPRLIKTDQLELEVYWKAPGLSKQRILGWRDRADLPTDIQYHTDHLGIVQNNFGPVIRLGEGDEVRDVPHPLAPAGLTEYDYALGDTLLLRLPDRAITVLALHVRPRDAAQPRLVGTLYLEPSSAELVRLVCSFTPAAYIDSQLEDLSIVLDNALIEGRYWLPYRQEIEIRRRAMWLDLPARGIIRGRWDVDGYELNLGLSARWFAGPEIAAAPRTQRDSFVWAVPLEAAMRDVAGPERRVDLAEVRQAAAALAGAHALSGLRRTALGARGVSDVARVNRVEGLALGAGGVWRPGGWWEVRAAGAWAFAARTAHGRVAAATTGPRGGPHVALYREARDLADARVGSRAVNSIAAQEWGDDAGDYQRATGARAGWRQPLGVRWLADLAGAWERVDSLTVRAAPAHGAYRANPTLGDGHEWRSARVALRRHGGPLAWRTGVTLELAVEGGTAGGTARYVRAGGTGQAQWPLGGTVVLLRAAGGAGGPGLPPHRSFAVGGRGTLLGEEFRAWGGARAATLHLEWRAPVPFPSLGFGGLARTPARVTVAPFAAAGWAGGVVAGVPWRPVAGTRATVGLAMEWLGLLRVDAGYGLATRRVGVTVDVTRDFWDIL